MALDVRETYLRDRSVHSYFSRVLLDALSVPPLGQVVYASRIPPRPHGDDELRTSVYPSNLAPIGAKLRQRAFRKICNFRFFDAEKIFCQKFRIEKSDFRQFGEVLEDLRPNGRQNQLSCQILLQIDLF